MQARPPLQGQMQEVVDSEFPVKPPRGRCGRRLFCNGKEFATCGCAGCSLRQTVADGAAAAGDLLSGHAAAVESGVSGALDTLSAALSAAKQQCSTGAQPTVHFLPDLCG